MDSGLALRAPRNDGRDLEGGSHYQDRPNLVQFSLGRRCRGARRSIPVHFQEDQSMKLILTLLGVILLVMAAVYFLVPAGQLPGFFPGHESGVARMHYKHGVVAGVAGVVLLAAGAWMGRR
jgi:hypothetical protein